METRRLHAIVRGVVQGVGFRYFVLQHARDLSLKGYVLNLADRGVEVVAEGGEESLRQLLDRLREGPAASVVGDVDVTWEEPTGAHEGFRVEF